MGAIRETAQAMDAAEKAIKRLTPKIEAAVEKFCLLLDSTDSEIKPQVEAALAEITNMLATVDLWTDRLAAKANRLLDRLNRIKGWHRVFHWGNIFKPGKPFTTVELIFKEV